MKKSKKQKKKSAPFLKYTFFFYHLENFRTYLLTLPFFLTVTRWQKPPVLRRYLVTIFVVLIISLIRVILNFSLEQNLSYIIFTFAVVISAWYGGLGTGLFSTILSVLSGMYFSPEPGSAISIHSSEEQLRVTLFIMQGGFISLLSESVQSATRWQSIILESISDPFITYDRNMRFMYVNRRAEEMLHTSRRQLLGKRLSDLYPDAKKTIVYKYCREALHTKRFKQFEITIPQENKWFDISLYPSHDGVSVYYQDITRRKRVEKRLRQSQLQFKRFVDGNIIGVVIEDLKGKIYEANDSFLSMVGYSRADLLKGKINSVEMTPPEYSEIDLLANKRLLRKGIMTPYSKEYIRKDKKRMFMLMGGVLLNKNTQQSMKFYLDITEQKELEKKKNEFISIASHELKTPLTSVKAFTQILQRQFRNTKDDRSLYFLDNINNQLNKLNDLISNLLDVSKIEEGRLIFQEKPFLIDNLVQKIVVDFQYITSSHVIEKQGSSKAIVTGDEDRIGQVLINLISNGIKYSPQGTHVIVSVKDNKQTVVISVEDFGEGIPKEDKEKIFTRFFRSDKHEASRISGFGLGLYISKEIVRSHKGKIEVESKEGKGSTFHVTLPASAQISKKTGKSKSTKISSAL